MKNKLEKILNGAVNCSVLASCAYQAAAVDDYISRCWVVTTTATMIAYLAASDEAMRYIVVPTAFVTGIGTAISSAYGKDVPGIAGGIALTLSSLALANKGNIRRRVTRYFNRAKNYVPESGKIENPPGF